MNYFNFEDSQINAVGYTPTYTPTEVRDIEAPVNYVDLTSEIEMPKESDFVMLDIPDQEDFEEPTEQLLSRVEFSNKKDYIKTMRPIIKQALVNNGIDESYTDLLVAQTALESGWGKSKLSKLYNNFGGIKGSGALLDTKEFENGRYKKQKSSFKAYSSINEFADDYVKKLRDTFNAFSVDQKHFIANLKKNGYFTAPLSTYKAQIDNIVRQVNTPESIQEVLLSSGIKARVTSDYRPGARTSNGSASWHSRKDEYGNSMAVDIVPLDGDFNKLRQDLINNPDIREYFANNGLGIIDETTKYMMQRTGATGKHFHIGPDTLAVQTWDKWING